MRKKKNCKPYERLNLRLNECEQVCTKNLIFDRKTKKCVRQRDLCKPYQLYNITTKQCEKVCKTNERYNPRTQQCVGPKIQRCGDNENYDFVKQRCVPIGNHVKCRRNERFDKNKNKCVKINRNNK